MFNSHNSINGRTYKGKYSRNENGDKMKKQFDMMMKNEQKKKKKLKAEAGTAKSNIDNESRRVSLRVDGEEHKVGASSGSRKRLSSEEYAEVKKRYKQNDLLRKEWPRIFVNEQGKRSSLSNDGERDPLFMGDVQSLLFFALLGNKSPVLPRWVTCINVTKVSRVVMVHVEGIGIEDIKRNAQHTLSTNSTSHGNKRNSTDHQENSSTNKGANSTVEPKVDGNVNRNASNSSGGLPEWLRSSLPRSTEHMNHSLEIRAPSLHGANPVDELLQMKSEKIAKRRVIEEDLKNFDKDKEASVKTVNPCDSFIKYLSAISPLKDSEIHPNDNYSRLRLLLTAGDMAKNNFPLPLPGYKGNKNKEFVLTSDNYKEVTSRSPMFGLDCEMCLTTLQKLELTSISIVNEKLELVYHTLVLPYNPVINFLTKFSGITPDMLLNVTKRLEDVQEDLQRLLPPDAILVGHSLENDLSVLKMMHPYVIDSSLAYNLSGKATKRSSLKMLCEIFLDERIQMGGDVGHDPTEDAIASLKLIQLKLQQDEKYGNVLMGWEPPSAALSDWQECKPDTQQQQQEEQGKDTKEDTKEEKENNKASSKEAIGPFSSQNSYILEKMESRSIAIVTTSQCLKTYLSVLSSLKTMPIVEVLPGNKQVSQRAGDFMSSCDLTYVHLEMGKKLSQCPDEPTRHRQLTKLDKRLQRIHTAAPPKSVHIYVFSGSSFLVPYSQRSNGFVLVGIKDLPFKT